MVQKLKSKLSHKKVLMEVFFINKCFIRMKTRNNELERRQLKILKYLKNALILILDDVQKFTQYGSVFRTADAFLIEKIYLCGNTNTT
jgi:tRNA G18 (ribose-2'-O)-methylase SpoU